MFLSSGICPICEQPIAGSPERCPSCRSLVSISTLWPVFDRAIVNEQAVQTGVGRARQLIKADLHDGAAHYALGLAYLNLGLHEQGRDELRRAAELLPEQHLISYELAVFSAATGEITAAIDHLDRALQQAPEQSAYRYLDHYLKGRFASEQQKPREAVRRWGDAYLLNPDAALAREALQQFVKANEARLTQPVATKLPSLTATQQEALDLLNGRVKAATTRLPGAPRTPRPLGKTSLRLIRKYAPARAEALELMYTEHVAAHEAAVAQYERQRLALTTQNETTVAAHEERLRQVRSDLPLLAELCAAALEVEIQQQQEAARRQAEIQRRQEEQRRQAATKQAGVVAPVAVAAQKERQYFTTQGKYLQGLSAGKQGDAVTIQVSNLRITVKHAAMIGGWEIVIPMASLVEVADDPHKQMLSTEHRLRISYRDPQGMLAHALFAGVKVEPCVRKILQARSGV